MHWNRDLMPDWAPNPIRFKPLPILLLTITITVLLITVYTLYRMSL